MAAAHSTAVTGLLLSFPLVAVGGAAQVQPSLVLANLGEQLTLTCTAPRAQPWFFCLWRLPGGGQECSVREGGEQRAVCGGGERTGAGTWIPDTGPASCALTLSNLTGSEHGEYLCLVTTAGGYHTHRAQARLEVALPAPAPALFLSGRALGSELSLLEGETVEVECRAGPGYPAPALTWHLPAANTTSAGGRSVVQAREGQGDHALVRRSWHHYTARPAHSGLQLVCSSAQPDLSVETGRGQVAVRVVVVQPAPLRLPGPAPAPLTIGLASSGLVLLTLVAVLLLLLRQRKVAVVAGSPIPGPGPTQSPARACPASLAEEGVYCYTSTPRPASRPSSRASSKEHSLTDITAGHFVSFSTSDLYCTPADTTDPELTIREELDEMGGEARGEAAQLCDECCARYSFLSSTLTLTRAREGSCSSSLAEDTALDTTQSTLTSSTSHTPCHTPACPRRQPHLPLDKPS